MQTADLIIAPRWLVPVEPAGAVLENHAVVVKGGSIVAVLDAAEACRTFDAPEVIERPAHVMIPGFVNAHGHAAMTLFRGLADDLPPDRRIQDPFWPVESGWVDADFVRDGAELAILEMIRSGTTCFGDMYVYPEVTARAAAEHGLRTAIGMLVLEQPTPWASGAEECLRKGLDLRDEFQGHPRVSFFFGPYSPASVADRSLERIRVLADELELPVQMHVHETAHEIADSCRQHSRRPLRRLDELRLVNTQLAAVHMTQIDAGEIALLKERGSSVVHCPESNLKLGNGFCPVAALEAAGINVALGTDGAATNNDLDMLGEMRTCALLGKGVAGRSDALPAETVLRMATINGARALGIADRVGSLVAGKSADMICIDLSAPSTQPVYTPVSQLVYAAGRDQVSDSWVAGRRLLADGQFTSLDSERVISRAAAWARKIREQQ